MGGGWKKYKKMRKKISVIGVVGVPANYGGFETLVENLVIHHSISSYPHQLTVYCSSRGYSEKRASFLLAKLKYVPLHANGIQSIFYDIVSILSSILYRNDVILLLGVSGAVMLPLVRAFFPVRVITNIDGIEWRREKWQGLAKQFLRFSEKLAVKYSHEVIADNGAIARYVKQAYGEDSLVIAYGGDHAVAVDAVAVDEYDLPDNYAFSVCRIEPENNVHLIVEAFSALPEQPLVLVGNWNNSEYGREVRRRFASFPNLFLLDPIYDIGKLKTLRSSAVMYVHGHSAGGTNPSLVEAMHFGKPILAYNCEFNRSTTEDKALFFANGAELIGLVSTLSPQVAGQVGDEMLAIAQRRYTWAVVAKQYFDCILNQGMSQSKST